MDCRPSRLFRSCTVAVGSILCLLVPSAMQAEPYLAVRTGFKCSQCHVNMSGGGKRTDFGVIYSETFLPLVVWQGAKPQRGFFSGKVSDQISLGGNFRVVNKTTFGEGRRDSREPPLDNTFDITEANLYFQLDVIPDVVTVYVDETVAPSGASNRELLVIVKNLPLNSYFKAGRMLLPYGYRLLDDDSFIRQKTGFTYDNQDLGGEIGFEPGPFSLSLALSNGTQGSIDSNRDKRFSTVGSFLTRSFRIGGSFSRNRLENTLNYVYGGFVGLNAGRFTLLAEADVIEERIKGEENLREEQGDQFVFFGELDVLLRQGVNLKLAYDYWDPFENIDEDERDVVTVGLEVFLTQFMQFRTLYRRLESIPQAPREREDQLLVELHGFF